MPRIRTIKPEFWTDEKLGPLSPLTRLVYLGLISLADDAGRLVDSVKKLDGELFAYSSETCRGSLDELSRLGRIERGFTCAGQAIIQIKRWDHQKIDKPNIRMALPPIVEPSSNDRRLIAERSVSGSVSGSTTTSAEPIAETPVSVVPIQPSLDSLPLSPEPNGGRPKTSVPRKGGWPAEASAMWLEKMGGVIPEGRMGKALALSVTALGWEVVKVRFAEFLTTRDAAKGPEYFAARAGAYEPRTFSGEITDADLLYLDRVAPYRGTP